MPGNTELLTQSILSLLLVLALVVGLLYASKWFMQRRPRGGRRLRFIEAMAVGNKEKLVLVEVDDRQLLLGVSTNQVNLIKELDAPADNNFAQHLAEQVDKDESKQEEANS
jgi:flagellar protein FliO/FliZ